MPEKPIITDSIPSIDLPACPTGKKRDLLHSSGNRFQGCRISVSINSDIYIIQRMLRGFAPEHSFSSEF